MGSRVRSLSHRASPSGPSAPSGPEDIPDGYVRLLGRMMATIGAWHAMRPPGKPLPVFRFPPKSIQVVGEWHAAHERFCCNASALELARAMPPEATCFLMMVALHETGHPPVECTLADLERPSTLAERSS